MSRYEGPQRFEYRIMALIRLDAKIIDYMLERSTNHYDHKCRTLSQPGGCLYRWKNQLSWTAQENAPYLEVSVESRELDTIAKVCEFEFGGDFRLFSALVQVLKAMSQEYTDLNDLGNAPTHKQEAFNFVGLLDEGAKARAV